MRSDPVPFSRFEWLIAWRYLRARRTEGGVSVMTWISLIGITLAVAALIITLAVRAGFRAEFVDTVLGANAHMTIYASQQIDENGQITRLITDYAEIANAISRLPGVTRIAPIIRGDVLANLQNSNAGIRVYGITLQDLQTLPRMSEGTVLGDLKRFGHGISIGSGVARSLGATVGDQIKIISPNGVRTAFGRAPRVKIYEVVHIFQLGRHDIDQVRVYMPFAEAQSFFNREGGADELEIMVSNPDKVEDLALDFLKASGPNALLWSWKDASGGFLRALEIEDNVMFVILSILVLIASMNITSGLIMLVKNKGRDIGILRTIGLTEGSVLRVFFICGALTGVIGTILGTILGCLFAIYIDPIFAFVDGISGGGIWDPSVRGIYFLPALLQLSDILTAVALSLFLSFGVTYLPARRAARLNPVEALRYE